jgi:hypothetical protein
MSTTGINEEPDKSTNIGVAAHIIAASKTGPRYDAKSALWERKNINNGTCLCQSCSVLIDRDDEKHPIDLLRTWKVNAEHIAINLDSMCNGSSTNILCNQNRSR